MKSEEIIFMVFVGLVVLIIPTVPWLIARENKRQKEEEIREWQERRKQRAAK